MSNSQTWFNKNLFFAVLRIRIILIRTGYRMSKIRYGSGSRVNFDTDPVTGKKDTDPDPDPAKK